jgi:hypothetical protein
MKAKSVKIAMGLLAIFVTMPITFYLQWKILHLVGATELMWFLFWVNLPAAVLISVVARFLED